MASTIYKGKNLRILVDGKPIYHATECSFSSTMKIEAVATKDTEGEELATSNYSWNLTSKGLIANAPGGDTHQDVVSLISLHKAGTPVEIQFTTEEVGDFKISGEAIIESCNLGAPVEGSTTFDASFKGKGDYTIALIPTP